MLLYPGYTSLNLIYDVISQTIRLCFNFLYANQTNASRNNYLSTNYHYIGHILVVSEYFSIFPPVAKRYSRIFYFLLSVLTKPLGSWLQKYILCLLCFVAECLVIGRRRAYTNWVQIQVWFKLLLGLRFRSI